MSSSNNKVSLDGQESGSELLVNHSIPGANQTSGQENMKRAAAKQLIEQYYYQLTEGCGNETCSNENCASSSSFRLKDVNRNTLAVKAIDLSKAKAHLCERIPIKLSRFPKEEEREETDSSAPSTSEVKESRPVGEGAKSKVPSPTASTSSSSLGGETSASSSGTSIGKDVQYLTEKKVTELIEECEAVGSWSKLIRVIGYVFNNPESVNRSFRKYEDILQQKGSDQQSAKYVSESGGCDVGEGDQNTTNAGTSVIKYPMQESIDPISTVDKKKDYDITVDIPSVRRAFHRLEMIPDQPFQGALINALKTLSHSLEMDYKYTHILSRDPNHINVFIIIMEIPMLQWPEYLEDAYPCICRAVSALPISAQAKLARLWSSYGHDRVKEMVQSLQQLITFKVISNEGRWNQSFQPSDDNAITSATKVLKILYYSNLTGGQMDSPELIQEEKELAERESLNEHMQGAFGIDPKDSTPQKEDPLGKELGVQVIDCWEPLIPHEEFVNEPLNDVLNIGIDYSNQKFSFVPYSFILTTASKHTSMYCDNRIRMLNERRTAFIQTLVHGGPPNPFLRVRVRRDHLIDDALVNLEMIAMENPSDLRKQLFVEFEGEQGLDEGGVSKEFFQLIVEELFNPDIGMFTYNEESHHFWFNSLSFENDAQFTLIGILLGLAIYNSCILDIHFPMVVYRKLMGKKGTFRDLYDMDPTLSHSLKDLLDYEGGDLEDVFGQTFRIGYKDVFGHSHTHDLKENGENIVVTQENKHEFVKLYADYLLNKSIERQFLAFKRGFLMVTSESPLRTMFRPDEIEVLVCGSKVFDFNALEQATEYDGGFTADSPTIRNFWTVVHSMTEEDQRKLLQFTTGTDRVPVGGLSKLKMIIDRNGPDSDRLPTSHTCFNVLLLPEYSTVEKMRDRLMKAITYSKGFGML